MVVQEGGDAKGCKTIMDCMKNLLREECIVVCQFKVKFGLGPLLTCTIYKVTKNEYIT